MSLRSLNPYCDARWSRTKGCSQSDESKRLVLILVVVDDGLVLTTITRISISMRTS